MDPLTEARRLITRHVDEALPNGLMLWRSCAVTEPMPATYDPHLALVVQGAKRTMLGGQVFEYTAGEYLIASVELPVFANVSQASDHEPYLVLGLPLRRTLVAELLLELPRLRPSAEPVRALAVSRADHELMGAVVRLLRLLDRPDDDRRVLWPGLEREILWLLLTGEQADIVRQIGCAGSNAAQIGRAIRWIREHHADPFRVEDVARVAGMSLTSFYRHFRAVTMMTPLQYHKHIRLYEARTRLMAARGDVAAVGYAVGYESASQFSREYRRLFGLPPGQDAARLTTMDRDRVPSL